MHGVGDFDFTFIRGSPLDRGADLPFLRRNVAIRLFVRHAAGSGIQGGPRRARARRRRREEAGDGTVRPGLVRDVMVELERLPSIHRAPFEADGHVRFGLDSPQ